MFLEFILILQLVTFLFFFFNINRFFLNGKNFTFFFFCFVLSSLFILFMLYYNAYNMTPSEHVEVHLFLQEKKEWGITLVVKNNLKSYLCFWYNPLHYKHPQMLIIKFYMVNDTYYIFYFCIMMYLFFCKLFQFYDTYCGQFPLKQEFPLPFDEHVFFIFFIKYIFFFEFLFTAVYFVRLVYKPGAML